MWSKGQKVQIHRKTDCNTSLVDKVTCFKLDFTLLVFQLSLVCRFAVAVVLGFFNSCMDNYSMCYLLWIRTTIITEKSIAINLVQVSKQLPQGSSVDKLSFHMVNPELHSSLYITSGTQHEMFGVMCLDKKIEFAQRYLKIHCKSTLVQMRIEPGSSLSEVNIKIGGEWIAFCWKIPYPTAESSSYLPHPVTTEELNTSQSLGVKSWP